ncbi:PucR family transcriptional regulator [Uniformispora flossi]|uniref:PucR family transcriptional regulator n=1 Tax=Uniformispora flossi TaxID=3390723 RepID=UPI003C2E0674
MRPRQPSPEPPAGTPRRPDSPESAEHAAPPPPVRSPEPGSPRHVPGPGEPGPPTLGRVLDLVGGGVLDVVRAPHGLGTPVRGVALYDAGEPTWEAAPDAASAALPARGLLLLAVGVDVAEAAAPDVLLAADRAGAAAVVMRRGTRPPTRALTETARGVGTALLTRGPGTDWTELLALLRAGVSYADQVGRDDPETAETPGARQGLEHVRLGDLPALANVLADLVGGAITIEDTRSRVLAYSRTDSGADPLRQLTILGQRVPEWRVAQLRESGFFRELWTSYDVVHRPADGEFAERLAVAVRVGDDVLGSLWAAAADGRPLAEGARAALRAAARAAVPHLIQHRAHTRLSARRHEEALLGVLTGRTAPADRDPALGLDDARHYAVLAVAAPPGTEAAVDGTAWHRLLDVLALQAAALRTSADAGPALSAQTGGRMYLVVPADPERPRAVAAIARELAATARTVPPGAVHVAVGRAEAGAAGLAASRASADLVLRVLAERSDPAASAVAGQDDVAVEAALLQVLDRVEPVWREAADGPVHRMLAHDAEHGTAFGTTLSAYLAAFGDVGTAAAALTVHPNTLRYRLRRIRDLFGLDLADPAARLLADIGLRLAARHAAGGGPGGLGSSPGGLGNSPGNRDRPT